MRPVPFDYLKHKIETETNIEDCWRWPFAKQSDGYGNLRVGGKSQLAHRVSFSLIFGQIPAGLFACHRCDNPSCFNPHHIFIGTNSDNMQDSIAKGRYNRASGSNHGRAKLTDEEVLQIRTARENGTKVVELARQFEVSLATIYYLVGRRTYKLI